MAAPPLPVTTVAILLGASEFPSAGLAAAPQFQQSAKDLRGYLVAPNGLALPNRNVLDLFDVEDEGSMILERIATFLEERCATLRERGLGLADLIIYYVGHGGFDWSADGAYFLAIRKTRSGYKLQSSVGMVALRQALREAFKNGKMEARKYLILDCCFAGYAAGSFILQSAPAEIMVLKVEAEFASSGTALLCAASAGAPARTLANSPYTMFSAALLDTLWGGVPGKKGAFSLSDLGDAVRSLLQLRHLDEASRPEVHDPEQAKGEVSTVPLFPNRKAVAGMDSGSAPINAASAAERAMRIVADGPNAVNVDIGQISAEAVQVLETEISALKTILEKAELHNELILTSRQLSEIKRRAIGRLRDIGRSREAEALAGITADAQIARRKNSMQAQIRSEAGRCIRYLTSLKSNT